MKSVFKDKVFWMIFILASIYILGNIGTGSLSTWDEAIYANLSKELLTSENWLLLHYNNKIWAEKPPLYMWLTAIFYKAFGINEFTTRITSGLFGIAAVLLIYMFTRKISNRSTAIFASFILLAMPHFLHFSKLGMLDVPLTFFVLLMIYLFWLGQENPTYLFFCGLTLSLAYLMKGFAAFLGPIIIFIYCLFPSSRRFLLKRQLIAGILASILIISIWHFTQYCLAGPEALKQYFGFHIYSRATHAIEEHVGGINFYQKAIFNKNMPWSVLGYAAVFYILWDAVRHKDKRSILLCCWIFAAYMLYTAVKTKLHWYIMPVYPALAISSAVFLEKFFKNKALNLCFIVILAALLIQVPLSWAFKLDFCPDVKKTAAYAKQLQGEGSVLYFYGAYDNKEIFYFGDFVKFTATEGVPSRNEIFLKKAYCVIRTDDIKPAEDEFNCKLIPLERFGNIIVAKIRQIE